MGTRSSSGRTGPCWSEQCATGSSRHSAARPFRDQSVAAGRFGQIACRVNRCCAPATGAIHGWRRSMRGGGIIGVLVLVWLLIGVVAAYQRDYFKNSETNCATAGSIALTVVAGPLNYAGVNPKVTNCNLPEPSQ